jgi:hypothetical protein
MMQTRIYVVADSAGVEEVNRLIEATSAAAAVRYVASRYKAEIAKPKQLAALMAAGVRVEQANGE